MREERERENIIERNKERKENGRREKNKEQK